MNFNGIDIMAVEIDGETYIPIKPICEAIGVEAAPQRAKIQEDDILSAVGTLSVSTGADGKSYEMLCLPVRYIFGWLFTINPKNVKEEAREKVLEYRRKCYDALYDHFTGSMRRTIETNNAEIELLQSINIAISDEKEAKGRRKKAEKALAKLRAERLNPQPSLF